MRNAMKTLAVAGVLSMNAAPAFAQEPGFFLHLINQCRADAADYCAQITPGHGRIAACLYAHIDRLRPGCQEAVKTGLAIKACAPTPSVFAPMSRQAAGGSRPVWSISRTSFRRAARAC
ncbi:MAG: hypothetical protein HC850_11080 [Rhodomicrobium sp.]|nr:hypothetical protein [Rhodomicrobium sp.]